MELNNSLIYMIESSAKASKQLGLEATSKRPNRDKIRQLAKESTWHVEEIVKQVKELQNE